MTYPKNSSHKTRFLQCIHYVLIMSIRRNKMLRRIMTVISTLSQRNKMLRPDKVLNLRESDVIL